MGRFNLQFPGRLRLSMGFRWNLVCWNTLLWELVVAMKNGDLRMSRVFCKVSYGHPIPVDKLECDSDARKMYSKGKDGLYG